MYFPESEITPNLYTYGGEFTKINSLTSYIGYYFKTSSGKLYTESTPQRSSVELIKIKNEDSINIGKKTSNIIFNSYGDTNDIELYLNSKKDINKSKSKIIPTYYNTTPTEEDYNNGEFIRYFCKKRNELIYVEISIDIYDLLNKKDDSIMWELYFPFYIPWKLIGEKNKIYSTNKNIVQLKINNLNLVGFDKYLKENYLKFHKS